MINLTDQQITNALTDWVKDWCNNDFLIDNPDYDSEDETSEEYIVDLPAGVELFLENAVSTFKTDTGIKSESLGDYSVSFKDDKLLTLARQYLKPYRKVGFV